jgi:pimeloyl-ACP methyl ester carboxylesterase
VLTASSGLDIQALVSIAGMTHTADFVVREFGDVEPGKGFMWEEESCPLSQGFVEDLKSIDTTLAAAAKVMQPWLLIHGTEDDVVPMKDSHDAFAAARCRKELVQVPGTGHVFGEASYDRVIEAIDRWLESCFG